MLRGNIAVVMLLSYIYFYLPRALIYMLICGHFATLTPYVFNTQNLCFISAVVTVWVNLT